MIQPWVKALVEDAMGNSLKIGERYVHPDDGIIEITDGQFWGTHGVSNFWYWTIVATGEKRHGYGGDWPNTPKPSPARRKP